MCELMLTQRLGPDAACDAHVFELGLITSVWFLSAGVASQRSTVGFVERRHKEVIQERVGLQPEKEMVTTGGVVVARAELRGGGGGGGRGAGAKRAAALLRAQRSLSPEGHRSSSLPPPEHRSIPTTTPSTSSQASLTYKSSFTK